jgi:hypothetical protein
MKIDAQRINVNYQFFRIGLSVGDPVWAVVPALDDPEHLYVVPGTVYTKYGAAVAVHFDTPLPVSCHMCFDGGSAAHAMLAPTEATAREVLPWLARTRRLWREYHEAARGIPDLWPHRNLDCNCSECQK